MRTCGREAFSMAEGLGTQDWHLATALKAVHVYVDSGSGRAVRT